MPLSKTRYESQRGFAMTIKEELHRLIDELPEREARVARPFLEYLRNVGSDPLLKALMQAPEDDEPETDEERVAVQEARDQLARGEAIADDEVWRRLGHGEKRPVGPRRRP